MVDHFLALGGNYFDTAYTYLGGVSYFDVYLIHRLNTANYDIWQKPQGHLKLDMTAAAGGEADGCLFILGLV